jgi:hypothetical protein
MTGNDKNNNDAPDFRDDAFRDDDLRARFTKLRREEEAQTPEFAFPSPGWAGRGRRWSAGKLIAGAVCLGMMLAAVFLLRLVPLRPDRELGQPVASLTDWRSPTDFLLETPGRELLRSVPAIGVWHDYTKASRPIQRQKHPQVRKQVSP